MFVAVERQRIGVEIRAPERRLEAFGEPHRLGIEVIGREIETEPARTTRGHLFGGIDIALHFDQRDGALGEPAIGVKDRVMRIFPALIGQALIARAMIFDETIAIRIARSIDPGERRFDRRP